MSDNPAHYDRRSAAEKSDEAIEAKCLKPGIYTCANGRKVQIMRLNTYHIGDKSRRLLDAEDMDGNPMLYTPDGRHVAGSYVPSGNEGFRIVGP